MRSETRSIDIAASPADVHAYVSDLARLPDWAIGFAQAIRRDDNGGWIVTTASGDELPIRVRADRALGVVDFVISPQPGVERIAPSRVLAHADRSVYVFTVLQGPDMPDDMLAAQTQALEHELQVLKARLETQCPL
jgi:hypothetical protein